VYPEYDYRTLYGFRYGNQDTSSLDNQQVIMRATCGRNLCIIHQILLYTVDGGVYDLSFLPRWHILALKYHTDNLCRKRKSSSYV
jgi:hypothetical protein